MYAFASAPRLDAKSAYYSRAAQRGHTFLAPSGRGLSAKPTGGEKMRITSLPPSRPKAVTPPSQREALGVLRLRARRGDVGIAPYEKTAGKPCVGADAHIRPSLPPSALRAATSATLRYAQPSVHPKGTCFAASTGPPLHKGGFGGTPLHYVSPLKGDDHPWQPNGK